MMHSKKVLAGLALLSLAQPALAEDDPLKMTLAEKEAVYREYCLNVKKSSEATCQCGNDLTKAHTGDGYDQFMTLLAIGFMTRTGKLEPEIAREKIKEAGITDDQKMIAFGQKGTDIAIESIEKCTNL